MLDEIKTLFSKNASRTPLQLMFHVTTRCNSCCVGCYNWKSLNKGVKSELRLDEIKKISRSLDNFPWLLLGGGEPFLREDLAEICEVFSKENNVRYITLSTNGINSKDIKGKVEDIVSRCKKSTLMLSLSLDGIGEKHDSLRGVKGNFKRLIETYSHLEKIRDKYTNLSLKFHTTISNRNIDDIDRIIDYVKENTQANFHTFDFLRGMPKDNNIQEIGKDRYKEMVEKIKLVYKGYNGYRFGGSLGRKFSKAITSYYLDLFLDINKHKTQVIPCYAGNVNGLIDAYGKVYFCEFLKSVGDLRGVNYDFKKIWFAEKANKERAFVKNKKCYCYHPCVQITNIMFNLNCLPKLGYYLLKA